ncbi:MAG: metallophosphoesterase [Deltaproteobacteria bacterium]|nr:metallophosphoesterase [Deltaproteobacteria bacterium]
MRKIYLLIPILFLFKVGIFGCGSNPSTQGANFPPPDSPLENPSHPQPDPGTIVRFFTFGDWGTDSLNADQKNVAALADHVCSYEGCDFGLLLGDNFYPVGVSDIHDIQWQTKYRDIYRIYPSLEIPWLITLGNHDWDAGLSNAQAQVDYDLSNQDLWWTLPAFYYTKTFPQGSIRPLVQIFVINSNDFKINTVQQEWLQQSLDGSQADWKILAFHHPIWTNSSSHPADEKMMYPSLKPIICGKVDLLLSGHDHLFSHLKSVSDLCGYDQLVVGTGGKALYNPISSSPDLIFTDKNFGLGWIKMSSTKMEFRFYHTDQQVAYTTTWTH